jgi:hypothetical protein
VSAPAAIRRLLPAVAIALCAFPAVASAGEPGLPLPLPAGIPPQLRAELRTGTGTSAPRRQFMPKFELKAHGGYRVRVFGVGSTVIVEVTHGHSGATTAYVARGTVTPGRIAASFEGLGRVAVRFRPSGQTALSKPLRHCHGASRYRSRLGVFSGSFRFEGENGYVSIDARRAKGAVRDSLQLHCGRRSPRGPDENVARSSGDGFQSAEPTFLAAGWRHAVSSASFAATGAGLAASGGKDGLLYLSFAEQSEGRLAKVRFAFASGPSKALSIDDALTRARVSPPAPFKGTGTYRAAPDGTTTWTGPLSVNFPGAGHFPLTGPEFKTELGNGF